LADQVISHYQVIYIGRGLRGEPRSDPDDVELSLDLIDIGPATVGDVMTVDDTGLAVWQAPSGGSGGGDIIWEDVGVTVAASRYLPLTTTNAAGDDVLVFDADHSLIPTAVPF
jgi:hypothetical protein